MAFRNIYYNNKTGSIHLWTWDEDGNRVEQISTFEPYFFIESDQIKDGLSIFKTNLKKLKFENQFERNKFVNDSNIVRIFHNLPAEQQFLLDTFKDGIKTENPLKIFYLDIETYATERKFSTPEEAKDPINLITVYDSLSSKFFTWGLKKYYDKCPDNVVYKRFKREEDLLQDFLNFWKNNYPDVVSGWNIHGYDIPFIINRVSKLLGEESAKILSPVKRMWLKPNSSVNLKGQKMDRWLIYGVSILDYMDLYQTFTLGDRESYSLNYISEYELGDQKISYNQVSLSDLADQDWETFVDYNIQDVNLLVKLENKLKFIKLAQNLAYKGFVGFEKAMAKVSLITGAVAHQAMLDGLYIPTFNIENQKRSFEGGYVKEPKPALYENIVSYDANSLYPNTIITLNISPETKIGKITSKNENGYNINLVNGKNVNLTFEKFQTLLVRENLSLSKANVLYSQKFKGVIPKFIDKLYQQRVQAREEMLKFEKLKLEEKNVEKIKFYNEKINDNKTLSEVYKVVLNSCYGVFSQMYSPLFDIDHAESITLTGQSSVKEGAKILYDKFLKDGVDCSFDDVCKYSDTDSILFCFTPILEKRGIKLHNDGYVTREAYDIILEYGEYLNSEIQKWASKDLNSKDPRYFFKREKICDIAVLQKKKNYILHILDSEGIATNKFLYKGIELAKSTISKPLKELIKKNVETSLLLKDKNSAKNLYSDSYEKFCELSEVEISFRKKVNNYEKYLNIKEGDNFGKGTPNHVKAAINYNDLLKKLGLENKYLKISDGLKIKYFYCKKNKFGYENIAFLDVFPEEFKKHIELDYYCMFEKIFFPVIDRIYSIVGWKIPKIGYEESVDLIDFLS